VKVAHLRLCHSRRFDIRAYPRATQDMVFDAHARAFAALGGVPQRGIYDNMKTAVDATYAGRSRRFNRRFEEMCSHYLIEPVACTPASGWEKGQVENQVGYVRDNIFRPRACFASLEELNGWLEAECERRAREDRHPEQRDRTVWQVWEDERAALTSFAGPFDGFHPPHAQSAWGPRSHGRGDRVGDVPRQLRSQSLFGDGACRAAGGANPRLC